MRGKAAGWMLFLGCLVLLSFAATTRYSKTADLALICVRMTLLIALSVLVVRQQWKHYRNSDISFSSKPDAPATVLQRVRRWYYDER
ncbi:MAG: hypothetical protein ABSE85_05485 [Candidatus Korobacteraceae bacterium]|jgi:hypothetical protein